MIIGVTGNYASGKDEVAKTLQKMGFFHVSFSDLLREELKKKKEKITRDNLIKIGNDLRTQFGSRILARLALEKVEYGENFVFTSIRNPGEVELLQARPDFVMVNVTAPDKVRLQRIIKRNRESDPKTIQELRKKEAQENGHDSNSQQLQTVAKMAKINLSNDSTVEQLDLKVKKLVADWIFKLQEPKMSWDYYFMNIADSVKMRTSCMSPRKGAVIVRNKQIISGGYNGTAKGTKHCNHDGCERCKLRHLGKLKSGDYSVICTCAHAEENAIVQAAYNGVSTKDASMYTTFTPCNVCARMIINAGIKEVIAKVAYPDNVGTRLLKEAGVKLRVLD